MVLKKSVSRTHTGFSPAAIHQLQYSDTLAELPAIPVLSETLLLLDIETQGYSIDLRRVSQLILSDLGATVQILRLAGREYGDAKHLCRMEDCIADLGIRACMQAISQQTVVRDYRYDQTVQLWTHAREIAQYARVIATEMAEIDPEQAYLVGLLHAIDSIPFVLSGNAIASSIPGEMFAALEMARQWKFPRFALDSLAELNSTGYGNSWSEIVGIAHEYAAGITRDCPLGSRSLAVEHSGIEAAFASHLAIAPFLEGAIS